MSERAATDSFATVLLDDRQVAALASRVGAVGYRWTPRDDRLVWSTAAATLLADDASQAVRSGADYDALVVEESGPTRLEAAVAAARSAHDSTPARFDAVYCLCLPQGDHADLRHLRVEDRGLVHHDGAGRITLVEGVVAALPPGVRACAGPSVAAEASLSFDPVPPPDRERLEALVEDHLRHRSPDDGELGFVLFGIDRLSQLNEAFGFHVSEQVIEIMYRRLRAQLREGETITRFSGSKFGLLLPRIGEADLGPAMERFLGAANARPALTDSGAVPASVTAGGLMAPRCAGSVEEVIARAQDALHCARQNGRGAFELYTPALDRAAERQANLSFVDGIVAALAENRVSLAFQPIARGDTRAVAFHEALVRVSARDGRILEGGAIIPGADRLGLTGLLDRRSLELALMALAADPALTLSVNVSYNTIHDKPWLALIDEAYRSGLSARVMIELTESAAIPDLEAVGRRVRWLHDKGCRVAMDDFGVGYTSFRNLRRLEINCLKIDGSYISAMTQSADDRHFVHALLELSRNLNIETVAEWVRDEAVAGQLVEWGCTYLQGELIGLASDLPITNPGSTLPKD